MIVGLLGILEAGGAYLPLDPAYPAERLAFMLQDAGCPVLVTQARLRDVVPNPPARVVLLDDPSDEPPADHVDAAPSPAPDDLAYVIYTSGSTGRPKGVQIPHRALVNLLSAMSRDPGLTEGDVLLAVTTLSFDIAGLELFLPLIVGARLVLARREATMDGARLRELLAIHRVTVMQATPTTWRLLLDAGWRAPETFKILCGGEALSPELAERLVDSGAAVWNVYGPTETTIWSTLHRLSTTHGPVPIGRPIANTQLYVLDVHGEPVPIGVPGELYIGGRGVAHGYLNRAELTAERFVPDRFRPAAGGLLYRTGDLVRCRRDGTVEFLGRLDDQVKLRGFRIELGEIESVLLQHPDVQEATVVVREGPGSDKQLVGYVVAQRPLTALELRDLLRQTLPDYMIPTAFVLLDRLPLTNNGKIDRRALPDPGRAMGTRATGRVEPTDELERLLVGIWEETLERSPIGIRDDFFDLGGHSLLAVRVFARLHKRLGHNLPLATLFQAPTIEALATLIRTQGWKTPWKSLIAIQPHGSRPPLFAVPGVGGNVLGFSDLARLLGLDQPLYGLQSVGLTGESEPLTRIEEIAEHFLTEMRAIQPQGPYYLFGACIGGVVAYEMAQQLVAAGQQVSLLALVETWRPTAGQGAPRQTSQLAAVLSFAADRMRLYMRTLWQLEPDERREYIRARLTMLKEAFASRDVFRGDRSEFYQSRVTRANLDAFRHYTARQYPGSLVVFTAQDRQTLTPQDGRLAWGELAAEGMEVYSVPGHDSGSALFGSHVRLLVGHLQRYLATEPFRQGTRS
jgi:amino acid adenylation domain-containing protein